MISDFWFYVGVWLQVRITNKVDVAVIFFVNENL